MSLARRQREALCNLFLEVGALAPTACEGWRAQDLAAHLWIRERRPDALPGIGIKRFAERTEQIQTRVLHSKGFDQLVADLRRPAGLMLLLDPVANAAEYTIHLLDVARPNHKDPGISDADEKRLWTYVALFGRMVARRSGDRLVVHATTGEEKSFGKGDRTVHLSGKPSELLFYLSGRTEYADVQVAGEPEAVERLEQGCGGL